MKHLGPRAKLLGLTLSRMLTLPIKAAPPDTYTLSFPPWNVAFRANFLEVLLQEAFGIQLRRDGQQAVTSGQSCWSRNNREHSSSARTKDWKLQALVLQK